MADGFVAHSILLLGEGECDKGGGEQVGIGASRRSKGARAYPKLDVAKSEQGGAWWPQVFAWAQEEIKPQSQTLSGCAGDGRGFSISGGPYLGDDV